ncbi:hypothetical protein B0T17DRAFT_332297 [Bombardia bombarda]|uniref:Uncharacterized protein n=1 Tax=Bombardia bombarda TaxID=252184 RepID=A0AA39WMS5_9PEZI|nr:hypothetical protein B0T17DRAFT_332297 [Bombardia bombarda]
MKASAITLLQISCMVGSALAAPAVHMAHDAAVADNMMAPEMMNAGMMHETREEAAKAQAAAPKAAAAPAQDENAQKQNVQQMINVVQTVQQHADEVARIVQKTDLTEQQKIDALVQPLTAINQTLGDAVAHFTQVLPSIPGLDLVTGLLGGLLGGLGGGGSSGGGAPLLGLVPVPQGIPIVSQLLQTVVNLLNSLLGGIAGPLTGRRSLSDSGSDSSLIFPPCSHTNHTLY